MYWRPDSHKVAKTKECWGLLRVLFFIFYLLVVFTVLNACSIERQFTSLKFTLPDCLVWNESSGFASTLPYTMWEFHFLPLHVSVSLPPWTWPQYFNGRDRALPFDKKMLRSVLASSGQPPKGGWQGRDLFSNMDLRPPTGSDQWSPEWGRPPPSQSLDSPSTDCAGQEEGRAPFPSQLQAEAYPRFKPPS